MPQMTMRKLLQDHCSGSDTLLGSANVGASIFILLLLGFVVGFGSSQVFVWLRRRKQRKYDMEYRDRYKDKALGDIPDVDGLIKSAVFAHGGGDGEESGEGQRKQSSANSESSCLPPPPPGPLENGSMRCLSASIDKSTALLRSRTTMSQAEEVMPGWRQSIASLSNVTDPESPLPINLNEDELLGKENNGQSPDLIQAHAAGVAVKQNVLFEGDSRLDASANEIIAHSMRESFKKISSFDPPFQSAWEKKTEDGCPSDGDDDDASQYLSDEDNEQEECSNMSDAVTYDENRQSEDHMNNPFATTKESIDAAQAALKEMV